MMQGLLTNVSQGLVNVTTQPCVSFPDSLLCALADAASVGRIPDTTLGFPAMVVAVTLIISAFVSKFLPVDSIFPLDVRMRLGANLGILAVISSKFKTPLPLWPAEDLAVTFINLSGLWIAHIIIGILTPRTKPTRVLYMMTVLLVCTCHLSYVSAMVPPVASADVDKGYGFVLLLPALYGAEILWDLSILLNAASIPLMAPLANAMHVMTPIVHFVGAALVLKGIPSASWIYVIHVLASVLWFITPR